MRVRRRRAGARSRVLIRSKSLDETDGARSGRTSPGRADNGARAFAWLVVRALSACLRTMVHADAGPSQ